MHRLCFAVLLLAGCSLRAIAPSSSAATAPAPTPPGSTALSPAPTALELAHEVAAPAVQQQLDAVAVAEDEEDAAAEGEDAEGDEGVAEEGESHEEAPQTGCSGLRYTAELSDEQLADKWKNDPASLGSISIGFVDEGRLMNGKRFPEGAAWTVVQPEKAWATEETVDYVTAAANQVLADHPNAPPLRVNQISLKEGGYARPHKSHQNGRDVDLGFYYPGGQMISRARAREGDRRAAELGAGEGARDPRATCSSSSSTAGCRRSSTTTRSRSARTRSGSSRSSTTGRRRCSSTRAGTATTSTSASTTARAQELGRRVAPLLAQRPDQNIAMHRVRSGDTLGAIARRYNSSVKKIQQANRMRGTFLRLAQVLRVPMRGPCTHCPIPPAVVIPPRRVPPALEVKQASVAAPAPVGSPAPVIGSVASAVVPPSTVGAPVAAAPSASVIATVAAASVAPAEPAKSEPSPLAPAGGSGGSGSGGSPAESATAVQ